MQLYCPVRSETEGIIICVRDSSS